MIFAASCILKGSPGPTPGAPLKSPMVSLPTPLEPTEPAPEARFFRLKTLNISARSCTLNRSRTGMFLNTDRSPSANPGPYSAFRPRLPAGSVVPGQPADPGTQNAAGLTHGSPPAARLKL